eukprot:1992136-Lingulodinium_polyedra.AAC.1
MACSDSEWICLQEMTDRQEYKAKAQKASADIQAPKRARTATHKASPGFSAMQRLLDEPDEPTTTASSSVDVAPESTEAPKPSAGDDDEVLEQFFDELDHKRGAAEGVASYRNADF